MRRCERFVKIIMNDVDSEIAGTSFTEKGIHIGAVAIHKPAFCVDQIGNFFDLFFKESQRAGVGQHKAGDFFVDVRGHQRN